MEPADEADVGSSATAGAVFQQEFRETFVEAVVNAVDRLIVAPEPVLDEPVAGGLSALPGARVVVQAEQVQFVFLDDADDLFLHPPRGGGIGQVEIAVSPFAVFLHQPVRVPGMDLRGVADAFRIDPQAEQHFLPAQVVADRFEAPGQPVARLPVTGRIPPEGVLVGIPAGIDDEQFGAHVRGDVDLVEHGRLAEFVLRIAPVVVNHEVVATRDRRQEDAAAQVFMHGLDGAVEVRHQISQMNRGRNDGLAWRENAHGRRRLRAGLEP